MINYDLNPSLCAATQTVISNLSSNDIINISGVEELVLKYYEDEIIATQIDVLIDEFDKRMGWTPYNAAIVYTTGFRGTTDLCVVDSGDKLQQYIYDFDIENNLNLILDADFYKELLFSDNNQIKISEDEGLKLGIKIIKRA